MLSCALPCQQSSHSPLQTCKAKSIPRKSNHAHFADLIFQKCLQMYVFHWSLTCKSSSITAVSCASCWQFSQIEARRNTDPTFATLRATIPVKTQFFAPESASPLEIICSWAPLLPTYLVISHEVDQVDMMVWMLTRTIVRNWEVCKLKLLVIRRPTLLIVGVHWRRAYLFLSLKAVVREVSKRLPNLKVQWVIGHSISQPKEMYKVPATHEPIWTHCLRRDHFLAYLIFDTKYKTVFPDAGVRHEKWKASS